MSVLNESDPVVVWSGTAWKAGLLKSMLENDEIETYLKDEIMGTLNPWWTSPGGAGSVSLVVSKGNVARALTIIKEYEIRKKS
jgi:hypothetical protein